MNDGIKNTPAPEVKPENPVTPPVETKGEDTPPAVETKAAPVVAPKDAPPVVEEKTVGEEFGTQPKKGEKPETVPFRVFEKLKTDMKLLKDQVEASTQSAKPIDDSDIELLSKKYSVDANFLNELASVIDKKNADKYGKKIDDFESDVRSRQIDVAFKKGLKIALDKLPDYSDIVNEEVIKTLSLNPQNSSKTISQLIEETYANSIKGKPSLESPTPNANVNNSPDVDIARATKDPAYFKEIKADPAKLAMYNEHLLKNIKL